MFQGYDNFAPVQYSRREVRQAGFYLFLIGLGSLTQLRLGFAIGISEVFVYLAAPFLYVRNAAALKRDGLMPLLVLGFLVNIMNLVSSLANDTYLFLCMKGFATTYPLLAFPVVLHHFLSKNPTGHRWLFLGVALSNVVNVFVFQTSFESSTYAQGLSGGDAAAAIATGPIFWISRLENFIRLPISGWYWQTPIVYTCFAPIALAAFSLISSESGRSAALGSLGAVFITVLCGKNRTRMRNFGKYIVIVMLMATCGIMILHSAYRYAAMTGLLGEKSRAKYEQQSGGSNSILKLLMGGRGEFFIGFLEALNKPFIGHGPWALDNGEAAMNFLSQYGNDEDYDEAIKTQQWRMRNGYSSLGYIPAHSHLAGFFLWYGVIGLAYWLYVIYAIFRYLRREIAYAPHWFGVLAVAAPGFLWTLFFSGFGYRIITMPYVVILFMAHAYYTGARRLPSEIEFEIRKAER